MSLLITKAGVFREFDAIAKLTSPHGLPSHLKESGTVLSWFPETSLLLNMVLTGRNNSGSLLSRDQVFRVLQDKLPTVRERYNRVFPGIRHDLAEFVAAALDQPGFIEHPIREIALTSAHPLLASESHPMALGGLYTFENQARIEVATDICSLQLGRPAFPFVVRVPDWRDRTAAVQNGPPPTWEHAQDFIVGAGRVTGQPVTGDTKKYLRYDNRFVTSVIDLDTDEQSLRVTIRLRDTIPESLTYAWKVYYREEEKRYQCVTVTDIPYISLMVRSVRTDQTPAESGGLSPTTSQFLYFAGAVWEVQGAGELYHSLIHHPSDLPISMIAGAIASYRQRPREVMVAINQQRGRGHITLSTSNAAGLPLNWRCEMKLPDGHMNVDEIAVTSENIDAVERYVHARYQAGLN